MKQILQGRLYDTETAKQIASNTYWKFLYLTPNGNYFLLKRPKLKGGQEEIEPITKEQALAWWDKLPEKAMEYQEAFGIEPEAA